MIFNDYAHSMDRDYQIIEEATPFALPQHELENKKGSGIVGVEDIGVTVIDGAGGGRFTQSIGAKMRMGSRTMELTPQPGGNPQLGGDVEGYGNEEREEIRELAKLNEINLTAIHVPHQIVSGLSGLDQRGSFNDGDQRMKLQEVKKHINFARDVMSGGAITFHAQEYARPLAPQKWNIDKAGKYGMKDKKLFEMHPGEEEHVVHSVVDPNSGQVIAQIPEDDEYWVPVQQEENGKKAWLLDADGKPVIDEFYRTKYEHDPRIFRDGKLVNPNNTDAFVPVYKLDNNGSIVTKRVSLQDFRQQMPGANEQEVVKEYFKRQKQLEIEQALGQARYYEMEYSKTLNIYNKSREMVAKWDSLSPEEQDDFRRKVAEEVHKRFDTKEELNSLLPIMQRTMDHGKDAATKGRMQARQVQARIENAQTMEEFALKRSMNAIGELGAVAYRETKEGKCDKPIFLAPENMFAEMGYGSHPEELIHLVKGSRENLVKRMTERKIEDPAGRLNPDGTPRMIDSPDYVRGLSKREAEKIAKTHIKSTFDTAHLGLWYKHFISKPGETETARLKRFNNWYMDQVKKLGEDEIVGSMHVVDSMGYADSHIAPGKGIFPVIEATEYLKQRGVKSINSEGWTDPRTHQTGAWAAFGSETGLSSGYIFGGARAVPMTGVQHSYFGQANVPNYVFGTYSPSEDWVPWSGVPLE